ncbi:MAG: response regulator [bacterium]
MIQPKVLVVDDERSIRETLSMILEDDGYVVVSAKDGEDALQKIKELKIDLVILDVWLPKMKGGEVLKQIGLIKDNLPVIMISGQAEIETVVDSLKTGAIDFIEKPLIKGKILATVKNVLRLRILEQENNQLKQENKNLKQILSKVYDIKGASKEIEELRKKISRAATTNFNVLIQGKSNSDCEVVAHMIHLQSHKSGQPFIKAKVEDLELILSTGKWEQATLFVNNIDEIDLSTQAKILQILQDRVVFRIIASCREDLKNKIEKKTFREDLYYLLKEITIKMPEDGITGKW